MTDLYLCPNCLFIELAEEYLDKCPKCGNPLLFVDADPEFKHLIVDVLTDYGCEIASTITIILALTRSLYVQIRMDEKKRLDESELKNLLKKHENYVRQSIKVLQKIYEPENVQEFKNALSKLL